MAGARNGARSGHGWLDTRQHLFVNRLCPPYGASRDVSACCASRWSALIPGFVLDPRFPELISWCGADKALQIV